MAENSPRGCCHGYSGSRYRRDCCHGEEPPNHCVSTLLVLSPPHACHVSECSRTYHFRIRSSWLTGTSTDTAVQGTVGANALAGVSVAAVAARFTYLCMRMKRNWQERGSGTGISRRNWSAGSVGREIPITSQRWMIRSTTP